YGLLVSLRRDAESAALFAYTTLFRSEAGGGFDGSGGLEAVQGVAGDRVGGEYAGVHRRVGPAGVDDPELIVAAGVGSGQPRDGQQAFLRKRIPYDDGGGLGGVAGDQIGRASCRERG